MVDSLFMHVYCSVYHIGKGQHDAKHVLVYNNLYARIGTNLHREALLYIAIHVNIYMYILTPTDRKS